MTGKILNHPTLCRLLNKQDAAFVMGICVKTLNKLTGLKSVLFRGRQWYFIEEIERFLHSLPPWESRHHDR